MSLEYSTNGLFENYDIIYCDAVVTNEYFIFGSWPNYPYQFCIIQRRGKYGDYVCFFKINLK
jgi:hypothetical protein